MKWAGSNYEIVLEKIEMLDSWNTDKDMEIKNALLDWMQENSKSTMMEEGEDILDGLEMMTESGDITESLLLDCTEMITTLIVARNLDCEESSAQPSTLPTFQKAGKGDTRKKLTRQSRASSMTKIRQELKEMMNHRKPVSMMT